MSLHTQDVADRNVERLLTTAYRPEVIDPGFIQETQDKLLAAARNLAEARKQSAPPAAPARDYSRLRLKLGWAMGLAAALACVYLVHRANNHAVRTLPDQPQPGVRKAKKGLSAEFAAVRPESFPGLKPKARPDAAPATPLKIGETITTGPGERRRVFLEDGSVLYVNEDTQVRQPAPRKVDLTRGEVYVEVSPRQAGSGDTFVVAAPDRKATALGTRFAVRADPRGSGVLVTQGKVMVSDLDRPLTTGEQLITGSSRVDTAPRATHALDWTKDLMVAAESPLVPCGKHGGGALLAIDPFGQEVKLTLRKFHIDVHIEDGFARTTIDQTYFNNESWRLEGTFYFPLPPDASLSRLAMYVEDGADSKLNEGGMAERNHARQTYQSIVDQRRDPALLEWVDGSTFKMRVFPLEGRKEKRIILSYTQRLPALYGTYRYRFPTGHTMELVDAWSFEARVKHGAELRVTSPSHPDQMKIEPKGGDMVLTTAEKNTRPVKDVVLEVLDNTDDRDLARFNKSVHENHDYLMLRFRPELKAEARVQRRDWVILFEAGANRDPLLARTQIEVVKHLLEAAEPDDTFCLMTANTRVHLFDKNPRPLTRENLDQAVAWLDACHLIGALDLNQALEEAAPLLALGKNPHLVHVGAGVPALGERDENKLVAKLSKKAPYVGIGVGKKWNRSFMKMAAEQTNGYFTQINPDEAIAWKTFDLLATLNTPRLLGVKVEDAAGKAVFLTEALSLAQGEEICAITRVDGRKKEGLPTMVKVSGTLNGKPWARQLEVINPPGGADYLPRTWAKLEIDRLMSQGAEDNKEAITQLSMKMYVMSPFTSLLVLETDEDYAKFKVDRGRKDHWAMYPAPDRMPTVHEPDPLRQAWLLPREADGKKSPEEVLASILLRPSPRFLYLPGETVRGMPSHLTALQWYQGAFMAMIPEMGNGEFFEWNEMTYYGPKLGLDLGFQAPMLFRRMKAGEIIFTQTESLLAAENAERFRGELPPLSRLPDVAFKAGTWSRPLGNEGIKELELLDGSWAYRFRDMKELDPFSLKPGDFGLNGFDPALEKLPFSVDDLNGLVVKQFPIPKPSAPERLQPFFLDLDLGKRRPPMEMAGRMHDLFRSPRIMKGKLEATFSGIPGGRRSKLEALNFGDLELRGFGFIKARSKALENAFFDELDRKLPEEGKRISQRGMAWFLTNRVLEAPPGQHLLFKKPRFEMDQRLFGDLTLYAPGLHTRWADIQATLEREAKNEKPIPLGAIEEGAKKLIDEARGAGWETITLIGPDGMPFQVTYNGMGHFQYERTLSSGLKEEVIGSEEYLWHLYPEIGLAGRRINGRHYLDEIGGLVPWLLPPAEELARGADVKLVKEGVVALVPRLPASKDDKKAPMAYHLHLVFQKGRLSERRMVEGFSGKVLLRYVFDADGTCEVRDGHDYLLAKTRLARAAGSEPTLNPDTEKLLVIRFPVRTTQTLFEQASTNRDHFPKLSKALAEDIFVADFFEGGNHGVLELFAERFHSQGDRRLGFYVLLNASRRSYQKGTAYSFRHGIRASFDVVKENPESPLAHFLEFDRIMMESPSQALFLVPRMKDLPGPRHAFLRRLAAFRDLVTLWGTGQVGTVGTLEFQANTDRTLRDLEECPELVWAWAVLDAVQGSGRSTTQIHEALARVQKDLGEEMGLVYSGRYQHASGLMDAGKKAEARQLFLALYEEAFQAGLIPPIDGAFRAALNEHNPEGGNPFTDFLREKHARLLKDRRPLAALVLTWQTYQMGERAVAGEFFLAALDSVPKENKNLFRLAGLEVLWHTGQHAYADTVLQMVLEDRVLGKQPFVWRVAAHFAQQRGLLAKAAAATEKAQDLEFLELPEVINLEAVRQDYRGLLSKYHQLAGAYNLTDTAAPKELVARVVKVADRWRSLDPDNMDVPEIAARTLQLLGAKELAWDYLTTPIGMKPGEAEPWVRLAGTLKEEAAFELADRAYAAAFKADPTDAQILWDRAQNLQTMGLMDRARELYRQIADGDWLPRHRGLKDQAKSMR